MRVMRFRIPGDLLCFRMPRPRPASSSFPLFSSPFFLSNTGGVEALAVAIGTRHSRRPGPSHPSLFSSFPSPSPPFLLSPPRQKQSPNETVTDRPCVPNRRSPLVPPPSFFPLSPPSPLLPPPFFFLFFGGSKVEVGMRIEINRGEALSHIFERAGRSRRFLISFSFFLLFSLFFPFFSFPSLMEIEEEQRIKKEE